MKKRNERKKTKAIEGERKEQRLLSTPKAYQTEPATKDTSSNGCIQMEQCNGSQAST
jgi:hypothetical protein